MSIWERYRPHDQPSLPHHGEGFSIAFGFNYANTVVLMPIPESGPTLSAIERYRIKWMLGVPALYRMILESDQSTSTT